MRSGPSGPPEVLLGQIEAKRRIGAKSRLPSTLAPTLARHWDWILLALVFAGAFRQLLTRCLPKLWFSTDTYYGHGAIVPICVGIVIAERWPNLREIPLRGTWWALVGILPVCYLEWLSAQTDLYSLQACLFLLALAFGVVLIAGWQWLKNLAAPLGLLAFGLPVFDGLIDANTQRAQLVSTDASFQLLRLIGMQPRRLDSTLIALPRYTMDVGIPCSGLKILLAVVTFSVFFVLVANLKPWRNALILALALPLALVVNAIRITGIGVVGNLWDEAAAHNFHDYSGYISLGLCLGLQYLLTRALGWK